MSYTTLLLSLLCATALAHVTKHKPVYLPEDAEPLFEEFQTTYQKQYTDEEKARRFEIFKDNLKDINKKNREQKLAVFGITKFTDLTKEEFIQIYTGFKAGNCTDCKPAVESKGIQGPDSLDWRQKNAVTPVKNQQDCGSCWTFSTTGAVEGAYAIQHGNLLSFSEQQIVDCDKSGQDDGCNGGIPSNAMSYITSAGGIEQESAYPYTAKDGTCQFNKGSVAATVSSVTMANVQSEDNLAEDLTKQPISICLDATDVQQYTGGIMTSCASDEINHAVLLVGYGTESGTPFWIIKNSWGTSFGEQGYFRVQRGENLCGLLNNQACYPTVG